MDNILHACSDLTNPRESNPNFHGYPRYMDIFHACSDPTYPRECIPNLSMDIHGTLISTMHALTYITYPRECIPNCPWISTVHGSLDIFHACSDPTYPRECIPTCPWISTLHGYPPSAVHISACIHGYPLCLLGPYLSQRIHSHTFPFHIFTCSRISTMLRR
jgi:hypothetical protein